MANVFFVPKYIVSGENALRDSMDYIKGFGIKALIVTDEMMVRLGNVKKLTDRLDEAGVLYEVYPGVNSEPDDVMVEEGAYIYKERKCDFLIGLGGGSPMDTAKAIGVVVSNGGSICDYAAKKIALELPPIVAIPTTAGTGSEATRVAVIKDTGRGVKMMMSDIKLLVTLAVVDPVFTITAPPHVTANTGIDALCHAIESYTSTKAFSMSRLYSLDAIKKIYRSLPAVYKNGNDMTARCEMAEASLEAGIAFSNASVSIIHGMSRPIGALFHVPHGLSNAMLLKVCLPYIREGAEEDLYQLAREIGIYNGSDQVEGADLFVCSIVMMMRKLNIQTPADFGIEKKAFFEVISKMSRDAMASGSPLNCRNTPDEKIIEKLYEKLW